MPDFPKTNLKQLPIPVAPAGRVQIVNPDNGTLTRSGQLLIEQVQAVALSLVTQDGGGGAGGGGGGAGTGGPPPDVGVTGVTVGGEIRSHNTAALFTGTIYFPTT